MPDILPGFEYSVSARRYRDLASGRFVARVDVMRQMETLTSNLESRLGALAQALADGQLSPAYFTEQARTELRRAHLQQTALAVGGWDRIDSRQYGRAGQALRQDYARLVELARGVQDGSVTLPQALNRIQGYAGNARRGFMEAERDMLRASGHEYEERRRLGVAEHCEKCVELAAMSWQPLGVLPIPGDGSTPCGTHCRCTIERREVTE
jgi:hypothetical protein